MNLRRRPKLFTHPAFRAAMAVLSIWGMAPGSCGGGGSANNPLPSSSTTDPGGISTPDANPNLTETDVNTIVLQAINEANARKTPATIAVVDRVGNALAVTQMNGAPTLATVTSGTGVTTGLEGVQVPTTLAALSKAYTGAYLSSNGNAFSTRTANQIVQQHFDPGVKGNPGGPLFGVQFSQLSCSDFNTLAATAPGATNAGPHRSPLGFSADSGGQPIYKNGILVGGIGVMTKNVYSANVQFFNVPIDDDEVIAIAGTFQYAAPAAITADNIAVNGLSLQYLDASISNLAAPISASGTFTPLPVAGYYAGPAPGHTAIPGLVYGSPDGLSGVAPDGALGPVLYPGTTQTSYVFTDGLGHVLYAPKAGLAPTGGAAITANEAQVLMTNALNIAYMARAGIRIPLNSFAQVTVTVVDLDGNVLAQARTPDAPIFGSDVSRQKARSSVFFSRPDAAATISAIAAPASTQPGTFADYITRSQLLMQDPNVFTGNAQGTGQAFAWPEVAIGDISRPFYPDGIDTGGPGSLSLPINRWSVFSTGLQVDLIAPDILNGAGGTPAPAAGCATLNGAGLKPLSGGKTLLANGLQIFSGAVPIYRGNTLVGGIGISGDGIQQDSMVSFLGLQNASLVPGVGIGQAPIGIRADLYKPGGINLRYVNCPPSPFLNSNVQNAC